MEKYMYLNFSKFVPFKHLTIKQASFNILTISFMPETIRISTNFGIQTFSWLATGKVYIQNWSSIQQMEMCKNIYNPDVTIYVNSRQETKLWTEPWQTFSNYIKKKIEIYLAYHKPFHLQE